MPRFGTKFVARDDDGPVFINAKIFARLKGTTDPIPDAYATESGGVPVGFFLTNALGEIEIFMDQHREQIDLFITDNAGTAFIPSGHLALFPSFTKTVVIPHPPGSVVLRSEVAAYVGPAAPVDPPSRYLWAQTNIGGTNDLTIWVEDGV